MSQVNQQPPARPASEPDASPLCRAPAASSRAAASSQARYDFNAALHRAQDQDDDPPRPDPHATPAPARPIARDPRDTGADHEPQHDPFALNPFVALTGGPLPAATLAGAEALAGALPTQLPVPQTQTGLSAQSLHGHAIGGTRQFNLGLPPTDQSAALSLRLTQAGATHWQLRLSADAATRQQLAPHVERLRDRLRQRQGQHTADFELEDDGGA